MPDTGAPWNIPYVAASDLVKDWPTDNQQLAEAVADSLTIAAAGPKNVVSAIATAPQAVSSAGWVDVTSLEVTITPAAATSKVLLIAQVNFSVPSGSTPRIIGLRFSGGNTSGYVGDADGNRTQVGIGLYQDSDENPSTRYEMTPGSMVYLDSPATTSATTYKVQVITRSNTGYINRQTSGDADIDTIPRGASSLTAIEVPA